MELVLAELDLVVAAAVEVDVPDGFEVPVAVPVELVLLLLPDEEPVEEEVELEDELPPEVELEVEVLVLPVHWLLANSTRFSPSEAVQVLPFVPDAQV